MQEHLPHVCLCIWCHVALGDVRSMVGEVEVVVDDAGNKDDVVAAPFQDRGAMKCRQLLDGYHVVCR